jgi:1,4-dihydroxy-2-naphthoate octaprenyltransferase
MKNLKNYIGQIRLYSLIDLVLLLVVLKVNLLEFVGVIILHIAFLAYLESRHAHLYRAKVPKGIAYGLAMGGLFFYAKPEGIAYLIFGFLYTQKNKKLGCLSPVCRGAQYLFIVAGGIGYTTLFPYFVGILYFIRNLAGDFRDIEKDSKEGMKTLPIIFGFRKDIKHIHLIVTIVISLLWLYISILPPALFLLIVLFQYYTYHLTPR